MATRRIYRKFSVIDGNGTRQHAVGGRVCRDRRGAKQQEAVVRLSDYLPRPLPYAWEDGRIGRQRWWGNLLKHTEELADSPTPPPFEVSLQMAEVLAWAILDIYAERGLAHDWPTDPDPVQRLLMPKAA